MPALRRAVLERRRPCLPGPGGGGRAFCKSQNKQGLVPGFTKRYGVNRLVYYEQYGDVTVAIAREKQIKAWTRAKRVELIESVNPEWRDLSEGWYG